MNSRGQDPFSQKTKGKTERGRPLLSLRDKEGVKFRRGGECVGVVVTACFYTTVFDSWRSVIPFFWLPRDFRLCQK